MGASLWHEAPLQTFHKLHIHEIQQPVKVHSLHDLRLGTVHPLEHVLRLYLRRIYLSVRAEADAADKRLQVRLQNVFRQGQLPLPFLLFENGLAEKLIQEPRVAFLYEADGLDLLLHEGDQLAPALQYKFLDLFSYFAGE